MDHNLEDSLNLESAMGVDFDHSEDVVVSQADITLDGGTHEEGIAMEFEHIEEQPMLMDTGNEEIIVSDFMGDQFTLQEYSVHDDQMSGPTTTVEANQSLLSSQAETMVDLQFEQQPITVPASGVLQQDMQMPKIITVKTALPSMRPIAAKKETLVVTKTMAPRQVAIAPKPPKLTQTQATLQKISPKPGFPQTKQYAIAPKPVAKPVTLVANRSVSLVKKVSLAGTVQSSSKANTVLAQIGKQLVMMPTGGAQKIKLVTAGSGVPTVRLIGTADNEQAQLLNTQSISSSQTPKQVTKVFVQGQSNVDVSNQPAMLTKILPGNTATQQPRFLTMQQKTVPISVGGNKVILSSPSKQGAKIAKKQLIAIKSPTPKLMPAPAPQGVTTKKVVINTGQNVILKTTAPPKTGTVVKTGNTGQRTQLHQINVPGKGIQYIRLVTNSTPSVQKSTLKTQTGSTSKTFVLTDSKGNLIQMTAEKMVSGQPPPLIMSGNMSTINKLTSKPQQKLVRIAPITSKASQVMQQARAGQSLLAPLSPVVEHRAAPDEMQLEDREPPAPAPPPLFTPAPALAPVSSPAPVPAPAPAFASADMPPLSEEDEDDGEEAVNERREEEIDSKAALHALIADTVGEDDHSQDMEDTHADSMQEIEVDFERPQSAERDNSSGAEQQDSRHDEHPLIVIPSYMKQGAAEERTNYEDSRRTSGSMVSVEVEAYNPYQSPTTPPALSDSDMVSNELGLRPRKACNCTKSQCLKLYCDCFANGEFCNRCNCHNCFNNLENEELRQKAIRGCLDRNPNAFRPKIGKSKAGGPEIIRRHNKGCNCKRSGCLKNYCECYEAKIACTAICKCVGCRNVEETLERARRRDAARHTQRAATHAHTLRPPLHTNTKQPCSFMTTEVIEAVCQCLIAAAVESGEEPEPEREPDAVRDVLEEFARCLQDIISAAHQAAPGILVDEPHA